MSKFIIFNEQDEEWRELKDFPPFAVSSYGRVKNLKTKHILTGGLDKNGYLKYSLRITDNPNKYAITKTAHFLVALAFLGERPEGKVVDHIDHNIKNNHYSNLRYVSISENTKNTLKVKEKRNKKLSYKNTAVILYNVFGEMVEEFSSILEAEEKTGIPKREICTNIHGTRIKFRDGFYFKLK